MQQPPCICFGSSADANARTLILGSMPSIRSLEMQQYYAHPQNRFWPLMALLFNRGQLPQSYEQRLQMLRDRRIALWDVIASCERDGSLDTAITNETANDFPAFLARYPNIRKICFNGGKAAQSFKKHQKPLLRRADTVFINLPSTSPANAKWRLPMLADAWGEALRDEKNAVRPI